MSSPAEEGFKAATRDQLRNEGFAAEVVGDGVMVYVSSRHPQKEDILSAIPEAEPLSVVVGEGAVFIELG